MALEVPHVLAGALLVLFDGALALLVSCRDSAADAFLRLGHRCYGCELLEQRVPPERPLDGEGRIPRPDASILPFQHFDLLVQDVL